MQPWQPLPLRVHELFSFSLQSLLTSEINTYYGKRPYWYKFMLNQGIMLPPKNGLSSVYWHLVASQQSSIFVFSEISWHNLSTHEAHVFTSD